MSEIINGVPIGDLPGIESVPDDSMLVVEFLGKAYSMPGAVLRQMIQDVLDSMGDSVDDVTEARLTAAIETVLASGKYNGFSPIVEVLDEEDGTSVLHVVDAFGIKKYPVEVKGARNAVQYVAQTLTEAQKKQARENIGAGDGVSEIITVEITGGVSDGYDVTIDGESVTDSDLKQIVERGNTVIGVTVSNPGNDMDFPMLANVSFSVPSGTTFQYDVSNARFYFDDFEKHYTLTYTDGAWVGSFFANQFVFSLTENHVECGNKHLTVYEARDILIAASQVSLAVHCYQYSNVFYTEDGLGLTPPQGTQFFFDFNKGAFVCEYEGYEYSLGLYNHETGDYEYVSTAKRTSTYKFAESKGDDLEVEEGELFLLSGGERIGSGVPIPSGGSSDAVQYVEQELTDEQKTQARENIGAETAGTAAALPAVKYEAQTLTDTQKTQARSNIGAAADNLLIGTYGTVTYAELLSAINAGKRCFVDLPGVAFCDLLDCSADQVRFQGFLPYGDSIRLYIKSDGTKSYEYFHLNALQYTEQYLSDAQKAQARSNIGALGQGDVGVAVGAKIEGATSGSNGTTAGWITESTLYVQVLDKEGNAVSSGSITAIDPYSKVKALGYGSSDSVFYSSLKNISDTVLTVSQTLTDTQKAQARSNIGAVSQEVFLLAYKELSESIEDDVFIADNWTTYEEIVEAYEAGKVVFADYDNLKFLLTNIADNKATFLHMTAPTYGITLVYEANGGFPEPGNYHIEPVMYSAQALSDYQKSQARSNIGAVGYIAPTNVAGTEQVTAKLYTSNGGSIAFGKEGPNSGTMIRLDQVDGTCRLRFRASATAGAMVWEQPEQGAQLYVDLGKAGVDKHRITFPAGAGTLALTSQIPSLSGYLPLSGGLMTGSLKFQAASLPGKSLQYICGVDAFAAGGEMGWQSKADFLSGYATTGGNVNTSTMPLGFAGRVTGATWGNTIGTSFTSWNDPTGGSIDFRYDNPSSGKLSMKVDGRVYVNEGLNPVMASEQANGFWGMTSPDGENNVWIRTTTQGIIPYQSGAAGAGHCSLGTSTWYFANAYIDKVYGSNFSGLAAKATADANGANIASTYAKLAAGNTFNGEQRMVHSTYAPTMNDIAAGVGCSLKNARACDNQLIVAEIFAPTTAAADSTINMNAVVGEIGFYHGGSGSNGQFTGKTQLARITSAGIYEGSTLLANKYLAKSGGTMTGDLTVGSAKVQANGYVKGTWLQTTANNATTSKVDQVCVQSNGWIYTRTLDQLRGDMGAAGAPLKVTLSGSASSGYSVDKTVSEIAAAWNAGRNVYLTDGMSIYNLNLLNGTTVAGFSGVWATTTNGKSGLTVESFSVYSSGKVTMYSYSA